MPSPYTISVKLKYNGSMGSSLRYVIRGLTIEVRRGNTPRACELFAWRYFDGIASVEGYMELSWEEAYGTAGNFAVCRNAPYGTAHALLWIATRELTRAKVPGVIIQVTPENSARRMYARLGFATTNIPGIMTANLTDCRRCMARWVNDIARANRKKVS